MRSIGSAPAAAHQAFDGTALTAYLCREIAGFAGPIGIAQFQGGASNPTFLITDEGAGRRYVLRKKPAGALLRKHT